MDFIFLQDQNERTVGHLSNEAPNACPYYRDLWKRDRDTGASTYEFYVPANHPGSSRIVKEGYIVRPNFAGDLMQFQITRIEEVHDGGILYKFVYCEYAWAELNGEIVRPYDLPQVSAFDALKHALAGTRYQPGKVEYAGHQDLSSSNYDTSLKMAHDIKDAFGGEIQFRVTMRDGEIVGRYVDLVERVGADRGKVLSFEKNLNSVKRIYDRTSVATALIGIGKGDSSGTPLTFTNTVWRTVDGDPVDKPAGQDWLGDADALAKWGVDGRHITQVYEYDTTSPEILLSKTWAELKRRKNGFMQYEADAAVLDRLGFDWESSNIGDGVLIQDLFFEPPLMVEARIIQLEQSFTDPGAQKATFGDYEPAISNAGALADIQSRLLKNETQWSEQPQGMATIIRQDTAPTETDNVIWVQPATGTRPFDLIYTYDKTANEWTVSAPLNAGSIGAQDEIPTGTTPPANPTHNQIWADTSSVPNLLKRYDSVSATWQPFAPVTPEQINAEPTIIKQTTPPPHLEGRLWIDTSTEPNITYRSSAGSWVKTTPTNPEEIGAEGLIYKQATAPAHAAGRIWIDTSTTPNRQYRSTGAAWVNITPTSAGDVGADPAGSAGAAQDAAEDTARNQAKVAEYKAYLAAMSELMHDISRRAEPIVANGSYYTTSVYNSIYWGRQDLWTRFYDLEREINNAIADNIVTAAEETNISDWKRYFEDNMRYYNHELTVASQDAGGLLVGTITGRTLQVANAGISNEGTLASDVRLWAGNSYANRGSAPFRVLHDGRVIASNITINGGSINVGTNATVGNNLYLGALNSTLTKYVYFNNSTYLSGNDYALSLRAGRLDISDTNYAGLTTDNGALYLDGNVMEIMPEVWTSKAVNVAGALRVNGVGMSINDIGGAGNSLWLTGGSQGQFMTNHTEQGYCGISTESNGSTYTVGAGVGVNFKISKNYTPSSISMTRYAGNLATSNLYVGYITGHGFWIQITRSVASNNIAWRGYYTG